MSGTVEAGSKTSSIAIIGIGCMFPQAKDLDQYWSNIKNAVDSITDIPATHWNPADYFDADPTSPDRTYAHRGGFLSPIEFDPMAFGITPSSLEATDTSQLLGLYAAKEALDDAGYGADREFDRDRVSVVLGVTGTLELVIPLGARLGHPIWRRALENAGVEPAVADEVVASISNEYVPWQENSFPGLLGNVVAGRIANRLDLGGTNCVVDAACASSLSALHLAILELESNQTDMVITGGVDTFNDIFMYMCFSKTPALSPTGNAKPFDANADGTILGEGVGMLVLKRLDDAERDGDQIYAVIKGIGSSSDGKGSAVYAPKSSGQAKAIKAAYSNANITPSSIELVEAHGTGTKVGDATEIQSLRQVYDNDPEFRQWCAVGSVKSQIGHTKAAAGAAGLIKLAMALKNKVIPPTIKVENPAPAIDAEGPFYIASQKRPWIARKENPRRAAVSAFGFGGSNFHCVLEEPPTPSAIDWDGSVEIACWSADSRSEILEQLEQLPTTDNWKQFQQHCFELRQGFDHALNSRLTMVIQRGEEDLARRLDRARSIVKKTGRPHLLPEGTYFSEGETPGKIGFLFPGQGAQYVGMVGDLACQFPTMLDALTEANSIFEQASESAVTSRLTDYIYPVPALEQGAAEEQSNQLRATNVAQPSLGAVSLGCLTLLDYFGLKPDAVAGHSYGELMALCAAGVVNPASLHQLSNIRGRLMSNGHCMSGAMVAIQAPLEAIEQTIQEHSLDVVIANKNSPEQSVISGSTEEVDRAVEIFQKSGLSHRRLDVSAAFHSPLVVGAREPLREALDHIALKPATVPVYANTTGREYPEGADDIRDLVAQQLACPVEFVDEINNMVEAGVRVFLEVGPGRTLTGLVHSIEPDHALAFALDSSRGGHSGTADLAKLLAPCAALGYDVQLRRWEKTRRAPATDPRRMTVAVTGANFRPQKKQASAVAPQNSKPSSSTSRDIPSQQSEILRSPSSTPNPVPASNLNTDLVTSRASNMQPENRSTNTLSSQSQASSGTQDNVNIAIQIAQNSVEALRRLQEQTARLHERFLEGQIQSQRNLQALIEQQQELIATTLGQSPGNTSRATKQVSLTSPTHRDSDDSVNVPLAPVTSNLHSQARPTPVTPTIVQPETHQTTPQSVLTDGTVRSDDIEQIILNVVSTKTGYPIEMLDLSMELDAELGIDSIKRVEIYSAIQEQIGDSVTLGPEQLSSLQTLHEVFQYIKSASNQGADRATQSVATSTPTILSADVDLKDVVFNVVAEKTGYPVEMFEMSMELDADLGIDSIKRVEIYSMIQDVLPKTPTITNDQMGSIQTLGEIVEFLRHGTVHPSAGMTPVQTIDLTREELDQVLLKVVSDKTGYPPEMLELEMELDEDLGIDSIKRVEILSAFQELVPDFPAIKPEELGSLRTLEDVLSKLGMTSSDSQATVPSTREHPAPAQPITPQPVAENSEKSDRDEHVSALVEPVINYDYDKVLRYVPVLSHLRRSDRPAAPPVNGDFVVIADESAIAEELVAQLSRPECSARLISWNEEATLHSTERLAGVILVPSSNWQEHQVVAAFQSIQSLIPALKEHGNATLISVTQLDGRFGFGSNRLKGSVMSAGLAGIVKTVAHEYGEIRCRALDLSPRMSDPKAAAKAIIDYAFIPGPVEIGITSSGAVELDLNLETPIDNATEMTFDPGDVILVTGGARGVTAEVAVRLAEQFKCTLVLWGRSPLPEQEHDWLAGLNGEPTIKRALMDRSAGALFPREIQDQYERIAASREVRKNLDRIAAAGAKVSYRSVNVRDRNAVQDEITRIYKDLGPVRGVVHGAGIISDQVIEKKTVDQFEAVLETKVTGFDAILEAVNREKLKLLVAFSSSTGRFGRAGQVDYAASNEILNKLTQQFAREAKDCTCRAINWGPWDGGMVNDGLKLVFQNEGVGLIGLKEGADYIIDEIKSSSHANEVVVLGRDTTNVPTKPTKPQSATVAQPTSSSTTAAVPPPSALNLEVAIHRDLSVKAFPFLESHKIEGNPVLPMALHLEWLGDAAMHGNPGLTFQGIDYLRVLKGVVLNDGPSTPIDVLTGRARPVDNNFLANTELRGNDDRIHVQADVRLGNHPLPRPSGSLELPELRPYTRENFYRDVLFHGPHFQGIKEIVGIGPHGIEALVEPAPAPASWISHPLRKAWIADPLVLDACFQMVILWGFEETGQRSLPAGIAQYQQFQREFPKDLVRIRIRVDRCANQKITSSVEFQAGNGNVIAGMKGLEFILMQSLRFAENA